METFECLFLNFISLLVKAPQRFTAYCGMCWQHKFVCYSC